MNALNLLGNTGATSAWFMPYTCTLILYVHKHLLRMLQSESVHTQSHIHTPTSTLIHLQTRGTHTCTLHIHIVIHKPVHAHAQMHISINTTLPMRLFMFEMSVHPMHPLHDMHCPPLFRKSNGNLTSLRNSFPALTSVGGTFYISVSAARAQCVQ